MGAESAVSQSVDNPIGLDGFEFIEFCGPQPALFEDLFQRFGFARIAQHTGKKVSLYRQNDVNFILNEEPNSFAQSFYQAHGPSICSTGFRVRNAKAAFQEAVRRGARPYEGPAQSMLFEDCPAIYGIGDSLIYFVDQYGAQGSVYDAQFRFTGDKSPKGFNFLLVDHLTNNVPRGEMQKWCDFYHKIFNFSERRYFDIKGKTTGLISKVMRSPDGKICIPINEPTDTKSQIQEYLEEYKGSGIQHLALLTPDILPTMHDLRSQGVQFLETPDSYYKYILERLPQITESVKALQDLRVLVDGDDKGYLLQIFTKNIIGPIFFEVIQRKGHDGFGEGNFQALFDAIERDQRERGYLT
jgi:4-hydroxyphenylpyruvate dioxygenase